MNQVLQDLSDKFALFINLNFIQTYLFPTIPLLYIPLW